jgi:hypothetical protein
MVVGNLEGRLKKWIGGIVFDVPRDWVMSTANILPGESGSSVLDNTGNIVALVHCKPKA